MRVCLEMANVMQCFEGRFMAKSRNKKPGMNLREILPLAGITVAAFIFSSSEFMPVALLTDIARSFAVTDAQAGMIISVYAWVVMILSLPLMILASRIEFKRLLLLVMAVFALGQFLSSIAASFSILMASRIVVACAHAIFWSIAPPLAVRVVSEDHRHMAMGIVVMGESVALIAGLPIGRVIGLVLGWRMTFAIVAIISVLILIYLWRVLPTLPASQPFTLKKNPTLLGTKQLRGIYVFIALIASAYYLCYSYIEPFLLQSVGFNEIEVTLVIAGFGLTGVVGSMLFSKFYVRIRLKFLTVCIASLVAALFLLSLLQAFGIGVIVMCLILGMDCAALNVALQSEIIRYAQLDDQAVATSIYSGVFNFGIGSGSAVGGVVVTSLGISSIGLVAGLVGLAALAYGLAALLPRLRIARNKA